MTSYEIPRYFSSMPPNIPLVILFPPSSTLTTKIFIGRSEIVSNDGCAFTSIL